jgi:outer membrane biosynthesis protein TonB
MKTVHILLALIGCADAAANEAESSCQQTLKPIHRPMPEYPSPEQAEPYLKGTSYMHVHVGGTIVVELDVSRDGAVSDARVVRSDYKLVGRNASRYKTGYFNGFLEMNVLPTVKAWRFSPMSEPCTTEFRFTWQLKEAHNKPLQPSARRNARSG